MADKDGNIIAKDYGIGIKPPAQHFHVKGHENAGWGMKARLSQIFAADGRTIMLAFDHGYIMGSTAGLERLDLVIPPLMDHADCLMATRGALRTCIPADNRKAIALRCSADSSVLKDDMSMGVIGTDIEEALRMNASCMAVQCFIGSASEIASLHNLSYYINKGERYGIPVLGVVAVGKEMERTTRYFALATRLLAEQGAHIIKTYYCENFEQITAACPVPIVIAGGKKVPEPEALDMAYRAVNEGAAGVDMGRNVLQAECPSAMLQAIRMVVHENVKPEAAYKAYQTLMKDVKQFMHVGVPTDKIMEGAVYAEAIKTYIVAPETNEFNIEYLRFEKDTPLPKELQTMVHVAYKVDDLDEQVKANTVVVEPWFADENTRLAFIMKDGILMELMEVK